MSLIGLSNLSFYHEIDEWYVFFSDVKHCNQLIAENKGLQNTYKGLEQKFKSLENDASDVADGSQKKEEVMRELNECKANLEAIKPVMEEKKIHLEKSLKFHEIVSALNSELQWIQEKDKVVVGTHSLFYF